MTPYPFLPGDLEAAPLSASCWRLVRVTALGTIRLADGGRGALLATVAGPHAEAVVRGAAAVPELLDAVRELARADADADAGRVEQALCRLFRCHLALTGTDPRVEAEMPPTVPFVPLTSEHPA